ncbi:hypothetical protein ACFHW2_36550 [Actinomadura sp. LOL_016]|uniref:hypothetical protein n=1 Tax=unclassified Actinomadura TaxID=2626254 RepID=UPI003A7F9E93
MADTEGTRPKFRPVEQWGDAYGFLDQVRARPGMWVRDRSLRELETYLYGYGVALGVHQVDEPFAFGPRGPFSDWLGWQYGWSLVLGWAAAIEDHAEGEPPLERFFQLVEEFRRSSWTGGALGATGSDDLGSGEGVRTGRTWG